MGEALLVQILLGHFAYIQFECFRIPKITVFELTQIECLQFRIPSSCISNQFIYIQFEVIQIEYFEHGLHHRYGRDN